MAAVNEAYRVLGNPGRRAVYDRSLAGGTTSGNGSAAPYGARSVDDEDLIETIRRTTYNYDTPTVQPARVPWRFLAVMAAVGIASVLIGAALIDGPVEREPDGVIRSGSCVEILPNTDAREVRCVGAGDRVVAELIPLDGRCPSGTAPHRDRLGLGIACVLPAAAPAG